jgi:hypothetical protein
MFGIHRTILQVDKRFEMGTSTSSASKGIIGRRTKIG